MTFSLAGRCERTGAVGAVIASASMAVAARCVAVRAGAGAVCSQSTTDPRLREALLEAMAGGVAAADAMAAVVGRTGDIAYRQLAAVGRAGGSATYSGGLALGEAAGVHAAGAAAAGNLLADRGVPAAMLAAFGDRAGESLGDRLIAALQAGLAAGGEISRSVRLEWSSLSRCRGRSPTCGWTGTTIRSASSPRSGGSGSRRRSPTCGARCIRRRRRLGPEPARNRWRAA